MSKSKAIGYELNDLLEKIEKQAEEYEKAFDELNKFFRNVERTRRTAEELFNKSNELYTKNLELYEKISSVEQYINLRFDNILAEIKKILENTIISDFNKKSEQILNNFEKQTAKALGLIEGSESIINTIEKIKKNATETDAKLLEIDKKNIEVDKRILSINNEYLKMDKIYDTKKIYDAMMLDFKKNCSDFENKFEKKIINYFNNLHEKYNESFEKYANAYQDLGFNLEERIKNSIIELKETQILINKKIRMSDERMDTFVELSNELFSHIKELQRKK